MNKKLKKGDWVMYCDKSIQRAVRNMEIWLGHTHRCQNCRSTFLAHEDGCPHCGIGARTSLIKNLDEIVVEGEGDIFCYMIFDTETGLFTSVKIGEYSVLP